MNDNTAYFCTESRCKSVRLIRHNEGLSCPNGHFIPFAPGTNVPIFAKEQDNANEYSRNDAATVHDNSLRWLFDTFGTDESSLRERLVARLRLAKGDKVLVTGAGTGNDLPYLARSMKGQGTIYAQDIAQQMLLAGAARHQAELARAGIDAHFSVSDATNLPFANDYFDAAYHFGGINLFPDIRTGIAEMHRVVKPGGKIVIGDEGIAPWLKDTEYGKMLIKNNALYDCDIPLKLLPDPATSVHLSWELGNSFYVIEFSVSDRPPSFDMDVQHVGTRGGSIRTRYFGQLEGVDPSLRDRVYAEAERLGLSRVAYLESLLRDGLSGN